MKALIRKERKDLYIIGRMPKGAYSTRGAF